MNYYVTKYALTDGIWIVPESAAEVHNGYLYVSTKWSRVFGVQVPRRDWFTDLQSAQARVKKLIQKKVVSVEKQLKKLATYEAPLIDWSKDSRRRIES